MSENNGRENEEELQRLPQRRNDPRQLVFSRRAFSFGGGQVETAELQALSEIDEINKQATRHSAKQDWLFGGHRSGHPMRQNPAAVPQLLLPIFAGTLLFYLRVSVRF